MEYIICCLNIKESYIRITNHFKGHPNISFEEFIDDIEEIKNKSLYKKWQYAVIDKKLSWCDEAAKFFKKNSVEIIYFNDDYAKVISEIKEKIPETVQDNAAENTYIAETDKTQDLKVTFIEKPVTKIVEKKIYTGIEKKIILICSLSRCAGATTLTLNLAKYLSNLNILSSVIEPPVSSPAIFNWIGVEEREAKNKEEEGSAFYSYPHEISFANKLKNRAQYVYDNIVWIIADDRKEKINNWQYSHMLQLIHVSGIAPITFIDVGDSIFHDSVKPLLSSVDFVFAVIDPFPTICKINNSKFLELLKLKSEGCPVYFIVNKWNSGIEKKEFLSFIGAEPLAFIGAIDLAVLYKANCQYRISLCYPEVAALFEEPLNSICSLFIPKEFMGGILNNKKQKSRPALTNIFKKFVKS